MGEICSQNGIFFSRDGMAFNLWINCRWICWHFHVLMNAGILQFGESITFGTLGTECFQPSLAVSGELHISPSHISSNKSPKVSATTCNRSVVTSDSHCSLLDRGSLTFHCSQHVGRTFLISVPW